jgi:hypothetical protein
MSEEEAGDLVKRPTESIQVVWYGVVGPVRREFSLEYIIVVNKSLPEPTLVTRPEPDQQVDVTLLPHWARVAFAARCARRVYPLFSKSWPKAIIRRSDSVLRAIELAERSGTEGKAVEGLDSAISQTVVTAGAALRSVYGFAIDEAPANDNDSATIASFVSHVAGKAATAANASFDNSSLPALEAYSFSQDAATSAAAITILIDIEEDFARLHRAVIRGGWTDKTAVPPSVFDSL